MGLGSRLGAAMTALPRGRRGGRMAQAGPADGGADVRAEAEALAADPVDRDEAARVLQEMDELRVAPNADGH